MTVKTSYIIDRVLHWISSLLILFLLIDMGTRIHNVDYRIKGAIQHKQDAIELHVIIALLLAITLIIRIIWYQFYLHQTHKVNFNSTFHKWLVRSIHSAMYLTILILMCSGFMMLTNYEHPLTFFDLLSFSIEGFDNTLFLDSNNWHLYFKSALYGLIFFHIIGAIYQRR